MCHIAAIKSDAQYWQLQDKKFKQYLILCSPGAEYVL